MSSPSVAIADEVIYQPLQDELVLLNMKEQKYFGLDDVGTDMWNLLLESGDIATVADRMCEEYEVDKPTVLGDLEALVNNLVAAGLLKTKSEESL